MNIQIRTMTTENNQLTTLEKFDINNVIITEPLDETNGKRSKFLYRNEDGSEGQLSILGEKCWCFGIKEYLTKGSNELIGYKIPIALYNNQVGPTPAQQRMIDVFNSVTDMTKEFLLTNKKLFKKPLLTMDQLLGLNPVVWRLDDDGNVLPNCAPTLFARLIWSSRYNKIYTKFVTTENEEIAPKELMGKSFSITPIIKFDSIFSGSQLSLQLRLYEAIVEFRQVEHKSLLTGLVGVRKEEIIEEENQ